MFLYSKSNDDDDDDEKMLTNRKKESPLCILGSSTPKCTNRYEDQLRQKAKESRVFLF
jgi:hypothetical protein